MGERRHFRFLTDEFLVSADPTAARAAHILHERPTDPALVLDLLTAATARIERDAPGPQVLVVVPDADAALGVAELAAELPSAAGLVPVTSVKRAARLLPAGPATVVGGLADCVELLRRSVLKVEHVSQLLVLEAERLDTPADVESLDALLAELPKDATRIVVAATISDAVRDLAERHLHRARRMSAPTPVAAALPAMQVYVASPATRGAAVARLLDDLDPPSVTIVAERAGDRAAAQAVLDRLGLSMPLASVVGAAGPVPEHVAVVVCWGIPSSRALSSIASAQATRVVAMVGARDRRALATVAAGAELTPYVPDESSRTVRAADAKLRAALRDQLSRGTPLRELAALEPLFDLFEPADVAAAAVRLLDIARAQLTALQSAPPAVVVAAPAPAAAPDVRESRPAGRESRDRRDGPPRERSRDDAGRGRGGPRGGSRDGGPRSGGSREGGSGPRGFKKPGARPPARGGAPMRDGPKGFGRGRPARGPEEGGPRKEWQERGERMRNAKRSRND